MAFFGFLRKNDERAMRAGDAGVRSRDDEGSRLAEVSMGEPG
jgi:hypothetical protein